MRGKYGHWFPLITRCPLVIFPDFGFVTIYTSNNLEILQMRRIIYSHYWEKIFMEDLVRKIQKELEDAFGGEYVVEYKLLLGKVNITSK